MNQQSKPDLLISSVWRNRFLLPYSLEYLDTSSENVNLFESIIVSLPYALEDEESVRVELPILSVRYPYVKFRIISRRRHKCIHFEGLIFHSTYLVFSVDDRIVLNINRQLFFKTLAISSEKGANACASIIAELMSSA